MVGVTTQQLALLRLNTPNLEGLGCHSQQHATAVVAPLPLLACADPYVGGLAEPAQGGAHMGPLFAASIKEQFGRLRDADWWYYENGAKNKLYSEAEIAEISSTSEGTRQ